MIRYFTLALLTALAGCSSSSTAGDPLLVSAAADLMPAFTELGESFERDTGVEVVFNFGSTGLLTQQIQQGAPVDVFAAANVAFIDQLARDGLILPDTHTVYAVGRLTLWTRADSPLVLNSLDDLTGPDVTRVAIANPEHAPYGVAAREALTSAGVWDVVQPKLIYGENISQTLEFARTGNADAALVALSLSLPSDGRWTLIPDDLHAPLIQSLTVIADTPREESARRFAAYVNSEAGREIMRRYGFVLPGEALVLP